MRISNHFKIILAAFLPLTGSALGFVSLPVNHGAPTADELATLQKINRFRANPTDELAIMFTESFAGTYSNADIQNTLENQNWSPGFWVTNFGNNVVSGSMDFYETRPGTVYSQFQALSPATSSLVWSDNLGWAAHQYSTWVEIDAGASPNPHAVTGAPSFPDRFDKAGVNWLAIGENIAPNWPMNVNHMHMGFVVDWGTGIDGIQNPPGHRNSMLNNSFTQLGVGIADAGWGSGRFTNVQHFSNTFSTSPIVFGFVFDSNGDRLAAATVEVRDALDNVIGTATTDAIGAYTLIVPSGQTPATAVYSDGALTSDPLTLGSENGNWFLDVQVIPEPSSSLLVFLAAITISFQRKRR